MIRTVVIGSGNVATSLTPALDALDSVEIVQVYSPTPLHATELAGKLHNAAAVTSTRQITPDADMYLISVRDDAIDAVVDAVSGLNTEALWIHTAGTLGIERLARCGVNYGVFYPLQTFSRHRPLTFSEIPVFIEGSTPQVTDNLQALAGKLSRRVYAVDSDTRRVVHLAAVFGCNFVNHLWTIAEELLAERGLHFDILEPLLNETLRKALADSPQRGQTGPARRNDQGAMASHIAMLDANDAHIYSLLSESIIKMYNEK